VINSRTAEIGIPSSQKSFITAMKHKQGNIARWIPPWLVIACLVLVLGSAAAQALHFHVDGLEKDARHCSVCPLLHQASRVASICHINVAFQQIGSLSILLVADSKAEQHSSPYASRPPPAV
jgi:hypothetical protein